MKKSRPLITLLVLLHFTVLLFHGLAHTKLGIGQAFFHTVFIALTYWLAPIVSAILVWTKYRQSGIALFVLCMFCGLIYGVSYHFLAVTPDNIRFLPAGEWTLTFRLTAVLLAIFESLGIVVGVLSLRNDLPLHGN